MSVYNSPSNSFVPMFWEQSSRRGIGISGGKERGGRGEGWHKKRLLHYQGAIGGCEWYPLQLESAESRLVQSTAVMVANGSYIPVLQGFSFLFQPGQEIRMNQSQWEKGELFSPTHPPATTMHIQFAVVLYTTIKPIQHTRTMYDARAMLHTSP